MIIENVIGNMKNRDTDSFKKDYVEIHWYESRKRINRLMSKNGAEIGIKLDDHTADHGLQEGDILLLNEDTKELIYVSILPEKCIVVEGVNTKMMAKLAYEIGNRHAPLFYGAHDFQLVVPFDEPMQELLKKYSSSIEVAEMKLLESNAISSVSNKGDHHH